MSHGKLGALWQPYELLIIGGCAVGALIIANPNKVLKGILKSMASLLRGAKYNKKSYLDLLALMYDLFGKARKEGMMAIEADIEDPSNSELFKRFPKILHDHHVMEFIADYLRIIVGGNMNPFELENLMDVELSTHHHETNLPCEALTKTADALPGFGIVAAVLGIVITMASISGTAAEIGAHVAAALVGTFLGILLAYGWIGPMAVALEHRNRDEAKIFECIKVCLLATVNGYSPQVAVEFGRKILFSSVRPSFTELETFLKQSR